MSEFVEISDPSYKAQRSTNSPFNTDLTVLSSIPLADLSLEMSTIAGTDLSLSTLVSTSRLGVLVWYLVVICMKFKAVFSDPPTGAGFVESDMVVLSTNLTK